jgi:predicted MFS family arabinose efflux permease
MMSLVFSLKQTGVPIGGALAGAVVPTLVLLGGWRMSVIAVAAACIAVAILAQSLRRQFDDDSDSTRRIGAKSALRSMNLAIHEPAARRLATCSFFFASVQLCFVTYLVTYLTSQVSLSLVQAGLMLPVAQGAGIFARIASGAAADLSGRPVTVLGLIAFGMATAGLATALFSPEWPLVLVAIVCGVFGATAIGWNGVFLAEVARQAPAGKAAEATGGALFFTYFGVLVYCAVNI